MLKIRLKRVGRKHDPSYRIVVTDSRRGPKSGNYAEMLGSYDPRGKTKGLPINADRTAYWLKQGAQLSDTVHNILVDQKIINGAKIRPIKASRAEGKSAAPAATEAVA